MIQLELSNEEAAALLDLLLHQQPQLRIEIASTNSGRFRSQLKERKALLNRIRGRLFELQVQELAEAA